MLLDVLVIGCVNIKVVIGSVVLNLLCCVVIGVGKVVTNVILVLLLSVVPAIVVDNFVGNVDRVGCILLGLVVRWIVGGTVGGTVGRAVGRAVGRDDGVTVGIAVGINIGFVVWRDVACFIVDKVCVLINILVELLIFEVWRVFARVVPLYVVKGAATFVGINVLIGPALLDKKTVCLKVTYGFAVFFGTFVAIIPIFVFEVGIVVNPETPVGVQIKYKP